MNFTVCYNHMCAAVDMLAWSPDGNVYVMVTDDHIDVCAFEVCDVMCDFMFVEFCYTFTKKVMILSWYVCWLILWRGNS